MTTLFEATHRLATQERMCKMTDSEEPKPEEPKEDNDIYENYDYE